MTGGRVAHPLLISLANISMDFRNKASNEAFLLVALIPIPKFLHPKTKIRSVLEARLFHECLDFILRPLKQAAQQGVLMADPFGQNRWCFTPLASYIVDTPESALISGVGSKTSSVTTASYQQFGDDFRHPSRLARNTLSVLIEIEKLVQPWDLEEYEREAKRFRLNGVHRPFWRDWPLSDPSVFLTSEPLHHWHKQFWDHDVKWCIYAVGDKELDFRFSILPPRTGYRHFREGISTLKQVTGREHRDIQRYIIPVIANAVSPLFVTAIRALLDFRYYAQSNVISEDICKKIEGSLQLFHQNKEAITTAGARRGKNGPIPNWFIPKLEFLQSVVLNIQYNGAAVQWSADVTENAHIRVVKDPARSGNNRSYESQICRHLDRVDKLNNFELATAIRRSGVELRGLHSLLPPPDGSDQEDPDEPEIFSRPVDIVVASTSELLSQITASGYNLGTRQETDYFYRANLLSQGHLAVSSLIPARTYQSTKNTVYHLSRDASFKRLLIDEIAAKFNLPDLRPAIADFINYVRKVDLDVRDLEGNTYVTHVGGHRRARQDVQFPVTHLEVWTNLRLQTTAYHHPHNILPAVTINAGPPSSEFPHGRFDPVIVNIDQDHSWPESGISGKFPVIQAVSGTDLFC